MENQVYTDIVKGSFMDVCTGIVQKLTPDEFHKLEKHILPMPDTHIRSMHVLFLHCIRYRDDDCYIRGVIKYKGSTVYKIQFVLDSDAHGQYKEIRQTIYHEDGQDFDRAEIVELADKFISIVQKIMDGTEFTDEDRQNLYINNLIVVAHRIKLKLLGTYGHYKTGSLTGVYVFPNDKDSVCLVELIFKHGDIKGQIRVYKAVKEDYNNKLELSSKFSKKMKTKAIVKAMREALNLS